jgi:diguanylate cyclase (GGDEF)-like protein
MLCAIEEGERLKALRRYHILDTPPEEAFDRLTRLVKMLLKTPIVLVSLIDHDRQWFKSRQGLGLTETPRSISFCTYAIEQDTALVVRDALEHPLFKDSPLVTGEPHIRFYIGVPLKTHDGYNIGTLCAMDQRPRELSAEEIDVLHDLAGMIVDEIELRQLATTDSLTGVLTRRGFEIAIKREAGRAKRYHHHLSLIAFDIDHFKSINDRHGHAAGDLVLRAVAAQIKGELRAIDFMGRLGGEEFVIALPETDITGARILAERIRDKLAQTSLQAQDISIHVTASFGIASYDESDDGWKSVLERADAAVYDAKKGGRNRCACHGINLSVPRVA